MSASISLTSEKFAILIAIDNSLHAFANTSWFASPEVLRSRHAGVIVEFRKLQEAFPEMAKKIRSYYNEETDFPEDIEEDYEEALFGLLLQLHVFVNVVKLGNISAQIRNIRDPLVDFAVCFEEFDSEKHFC